MACGKKKGCKAAAKGGKTQKPADKKGGKCKK